jgi:tripartite-type tricarboxylate transporter receptor subunit TctC
MRACGRMHPHSAAPSRRADARATSGMRAASLFILFNFLGAPAHAAESAWPARTVHLVVAQAAGGAPDVVARFIAEPLARALGVPVVVENRPGASGIIGVNLARQAAPDGYTLLLGTASTLVLVPQVSAAVPYDTLRDFAPVANLVRSIKVLWVNAALPVQTTREWIAYARARPGKLNYATGGVGSSNHVDMQLVNATAELDLVHVPYNGPSAAISAVALGDAQAMIVSIGAGLGLAQSGKIRPLAVFADRRSPLLPGVPTAAEQGLAHVDLSAWMGLVAPAGTPEPVIARINAEIAGIMRAPDTVAWANRQGLEIVGGSPDAYARTIAADSVYWRDVVRRMKLETE